MNTWKDWITNSQYLISKYTPGWVHCSMKIHLFKNDGQGWDVTVTHYNKVIPKVKKNEGGQEQKKTVKVALN